MERHKSFLAVAHAFAGAPLVCAAARYVLDRVSSDSFLEDVPG